MTEEAGSNGLGHPRTSSPGTSSQMRRDMADEEEAPNFRVAQPLPRPKTFDGKGARTFKSFIEQYENWALSMWGPNVNNKWSPGLENLLEGSPSEFFTSYMNLKMDYDEIKSKLSKTFVGEKDPFSIKKLLLIQELTKSDKESWLVFITRLSNIISEMYKNSTEEEKSNRLKEHLMNKLDAKTRDHVLQELRLYKNYSPQAIVEALTSLDSIPDSMFSGNNHSETINLGLESKAKLSSNNEQPHCLCCGGKTHYLADCQKFETCQKTMDAIARLNINQNTIQQLNSLLQEDRFSDRRSRRDDSYDGRNYQLSNRDRGISPYNRSYGGYSPHRSSQYQKPLNYFRDRGAERQDPYGSRSQSTERQDTYRKRDPSHERPNQYNNRNPAAEYHSSYGSRGNSGGSQRPFNNYYNEHRGSQDYRTYRGQSPYRQNQYQNRNFEQRHTSSQGRGGRYGGANNESGPRYQSNWSSNNKTPNDTHHLNY